MLWTARIRAFTRPLPPRLLNSAAALSLGGCRDHDKAGAKRPEVVGRIIVKRRRPNLQGTHALAMDPSHTLHDGTASGQTSKGHNNIGEPDIKDHWRPFHARWGHQIDGTAAPQAASQPSNDTPSSRRPRRSRRLRKAQNKQQATLDAPAFPQGSDTFHSQNISVQAGYHSGSQFTSQFGNAFATSGGSDISFPPATEANHNMQNPFFPFNLASGGGNQMMGGPNTAYYLQNPLFQYQPFAPIVNPAFWTGSLQQRSFMSTMATNPALGILGDQAQHPTQSSGFTPGPLAPVDATAPGTKQPPCKAAILPVVVPVPTEEYIKQSQPPPRRRLKAQPLLIILDLNGTLIHRKSRKFPPSFAKRPELDEFLNRLMRRHRVMVWSSSQPKTVDAVCAGIFPEARGKVLAAVWARDKLGLSKRQYTEKVQVYKQLEKVWADESIQARYPKKFARQEDDEGRWNQSNTVLIDDSKLKAAGQPYNILEIPEFTNDPALDDSHVLHNVWTRIKQLSMIDDVSRMIRTWESSPDAVPIITRDTRLPDTTAADPSDSSDLISDYEPTVAEVRRKRMKNRKKAARKEKKTAKKLLNQEDLKG